MTMRSGQFVLAVSGLVVAGCVAAPAPVLDTARHSGLTLTCVIDTQHSSLYQRGVLAVTPTRKVLVTVEAPDLTTPFTVTKTLDSLIGGVKLTVEGVPEGTLRVITLQWLGAGDLPLDGVYYRAQGTIDDFHKTIEFNNTTTAEGEVLLALMRKNRDAAGLLLSSDIHTWISSVLSTARVPNARFLDVAPVAAAMAGLNTKKIPPADPAWGLKPAFVAVGFQDIQPGMRLRASTSDPTSGAVDTSNGDTLVLGPIPPRDGAYLLNVKALPSADELVGPDLAITPIEVKVTAGQTTVVAPISMVRSQPGAPMTERSGRGGVAVVSGIEDQLWILNGVKFDPAKATTAVPIVPAGQAYSFSASDNWRTAASLPATFPLYGAATAAVGSQIFSFGGFVNQAPSNAVVVFETSGTPGPRVDKIVLPGVDGESKPTLANAVAAAIGDRIFVTGGLLHSVVVPGPDGSPGDNGMKATLVFNPATKTFDPSLPGPPSPLKSMAGAVVAGKWYLFGGFRADRTPEGSVQVFDPANRAWNPMPGRTMPTPRYGCATVVVDDKVWVIGGETLRGAPSRAVEVYEPAANSWTRRAPLRTPCSYAAALAFKRDGATKILVAGGVAGVSPVGFPMPIERALAEEITP